MLCAHSGEGVRSIANDTHFCLSTGRKFMINALMELPSDVASNNLDAAD